MPIFFVVLGGLCACVGTLHSVHAVRAEETRGVEGTKAMAKVNASKDMMTLGSDAPKRHSECLDIAVCTVCWTYGCKWKHNRWRRRKHPKCSSGGIIKATKRMLGMVYEFSAVREPIRSPAGARQLCHRGIREVSPPDPKTWFLTEEELSQSRRGTARVNVKVFTQNNTVETLLPFEVQLQLANDLDRAKDGDFVYLSYKELAPTFPLKLDDNRTAIDYIRGAVLRGVRVQGLISGPHAPGESAELLWTMAELKTVTDNAGKTNSKNSLILLDDRYPKPTGTIHQKFFVAKVFGRLHAAIGGVDCTFDRWDTKEHINIPERERFAFNEGWIDRHMSIYGPAAADLANHFVERWNQKVDTSYTQPDPVDEKTHEEGAVSGGTVSLQIIRTYPDEFTSEGIFFTYQSSPFAPKGEYSYLYAYIKAASKAAHHIYIEDQYLLWQWELAAAIGLALEQGVQHLTVVYAKTSLVNYAGCAKSRWKFVGMLKEAFPGRVRGFVRKDNTFIHSKMWLIDDIWMAIGSANTNYRSFAHDNEVGMGVVDGTTVVTPDGITASKAVFDTRVKVWSELSGKDEEMVKTLTFEQGVELFAAEDSPLVEVDDFSDMLGSMNLCRTFDQDTRSANAQLQDKAFFWKVNGY